MEKGDQIVYFTGTQFERHDLDAIRDDLNRLRILHRKQPRFVFNPVTLIKPIT